MEYKHLPSIVSHGNIICKGAKGTYFSAPSARRAVNQERWHNQHFSGFTLAGFCCLGLTPGIYRLPQHTMLPLTLGHGYAPNAILKGFCEATVDEWALLGQVHILYWEESLSGPFWSPHTTDALYCLESRPDTGSNQHKERFTIVNGSLCPPKKNTLLPIG